MSDKPEKDADSSEANSRRGAVRVTTVYGGRVCQSGHAFGCVISDVSLSGAKLRLKDTNDRRNILSDQPVQLIFDRLGEYKALEGNIAWLKGDEFTMGIEFTNSEKIRNRVMARLMPNRWQQVQMKSAG
ncbi:MAG: PilZ domain-containing protein [Rhodospirillaceae bacterium]|nr:PilZ domain-containing protein [Rhodospirillaceae bacterium]